MDSGDLVAVGRVVGAHGIRGELKIEVLTDFPERFAPRSQLLLVTSEGLARLTTVLSSREHKRHILLSVEGVTDRTAAEKLRGSYLKIRAEDLVPLAPGRYYQFQLLGLNVVTETGESLGHVEEILPTGGNLVLAVRDGEKEVLLPYIDDVVLKVDVETGRMTVRLMEGLRREDQ